MAEKKTDNPQAADVPAEIPAERAEPLYNPIIQFTWVYPNGQRQTRAVSVTGWLSPDNGDPDALNTMTWLEDQLLHGKPIGTRIEGLVAINRARKPLAKQPAILAHHVATKKRLSVAHGGPDKVPLREDLQELLDTEGPGVIHPGRRQWRPAPPSQENFDRPRPAGPNDEAPTPHMRTPDPEMAPTDLTSTAPGVLPVATEKRGRTR